MLRSKWPRHRPCDGNGKASEHEGKEHRAGTLRCGDHQERANQPCDGMARDGVLRESTKGKGTALVRYAMATTWSVLRHECSQGERGPTRLLSRAMSDNSIAYIQSGMRTS